MRATFALLMILVFSTRVTFSQTLSSTQLKFLNKNAKEIAVDEDYSKGNWKAVLKQVKNKEIVLIGEVNHGSKENFLVRNDLIKYLHEKGGYNVILFEAGIGELCLLDRRKKEYDAKKLTSGFLGIWRTMEFVDLMQYIKAKQISIAGFDVQRSSGNAFKTLLKEEASKNNIDTAQSIALEDQYSILDEELKSRKAIFESVEPKTRQLIEAYQRLSTLLSANATAPISIEKQFILQTIENRIAYLNYRLVFVKNNNWRARFTARDSAMAANVIWLKENIYKNEKVIIVGHNFHLSKYNEREKVMGAFLKKRYPNEVYSIGTFVGGGKYLDNSGKEEKMDSIDSENLDIRHVINAMQGKVNFLSISTKPKKGGNWIFEDIVVNNSFINLNSGKKLILAK